MKILIFGATGKTGKELISQAIAQGHSVTSFVRDPARLPAIPPGDPQIRFIQGDIFDVHAVADALPGHRAILSALGPRSLKQEGLLSRFTPVILQAMEMQFVNRLIVLGAAGAIPGAGHYQHAFSNFLLWGMKKTLLRYPFADQATQERLLAESQVDYTIVRPPRLTDGPWTGRYRVLPDALPPGGLHISRADVADFMLLQLTDPRFHRQGPFIAD